MPIHSLLGHDVAFSPEEANVLVGAFEATLQELGLVDRDDPVTMLVAKRIVELAKQGERDPKQLFELTIKSIREKS
jgi:hypothetical protein